MTAMEARRFDGLIWPHPKAAASRVRVLAFSSGDRAGHGENVESGALRIDPEKVALLTNPWAS
jgi:hypothetical protein